MDNIIVIENLIKHFGNIKAVNGIGFEVVRGSLFAFLGLNGAGKSTTINVICSLLPKDAGKVIVDGFDLDTRAEQIKRRLGIVFQNSVLDERLSVADNLIVRASYYGIKGQELKQRLHELSALLELDDLLKRPFSKLSGGQRRRVDIARGLLHRPSLLILDEPTTGLDPKTRRNVWNIVDNLRRQEGMTVFVTTQAMEDAAAADRVVILDEGKIAAAGTPNELKNRYTGDFVRLYASQCETIDSFLENYGCNYNYGGGRYEIKVSGSKEALKMLGAAPQLFNDFEVVKGDMDDVFLSVTGKKLEGSI